jgi:HEPN domain-containing protein
MKELANRWLSYADTDRQACSQLVGTSGLESIVAFHAQQTIEKSYKALLVFLDQSPPRIHDLPRLAGFVTAMIDDPTYDAAVLARITQYYTQSRYPLTMEADEKAIPSVEETREMVAHANRVFEFAKGTIASG